MHGLSDQSLKDMFYTTVIGKLIYCAPEWHEFCSASESDYVRLQFHSYLRRRLKLRYHLHGHLPGMATPVRTCAANGLTVLR